MESTSFLRFLFLILGALLFLLLFSYYWSSSHSATTTTRDHKSDIPHHPLDPLTVQEINVAAQSSTPTLPSPPRPPPSPSTPSPSMNPLSASSSTGTIHSLSLDEPPKCIILNWHPNDTLPSHRTTVIAHFHDDPHILSINLSSYTVIRHPVPTSGFPAMTVDDMISSIWAPHANPAFNSFVLAQGVCLSDLACLRISFGLFGAKEEGRHFIKIQCYSVEGTTNFYMHSIEGLTVREERAKDLRRNSHQCLVLVLTFIAYSCYHPSRKPTGIVKSILDPDSYTSP